MYSGVEQLKLEETPRIRLRAKRCKNGKKRMERMVDGGGGGGSVRVHSVSDMLLSTGVGRLLCCVLVSWRNEGGGGGEVCFCKRGAEATVFTQFISFIFAHFATISRIHGMRGWVWEEWVGMRRRRQRWRLGMRVSRFKPCIFPYSVFYLWLLLSLSL